MKYSSKYHEHLYKDSVQGTNEHKLKQLMDTLGLIEKCKDRINSRVEDCKQWYGVNESGKTKCTAEDQIYIDRFTAIIKRLKPYYNFKLAQLLPFPDIS